MSRYSCHPSATEIRCAQVRRSGTAAAIASRVEAARRALQRDDRGEGAAGVPDRGRDGAEPGLALLDRLGEALRADALDLRRERGRVGDRPRRERRPACRAGSGTSPKASITLPADDAWPTLGRPSRVTPCR